MSLKMDKMGSWRYSNSKIEMKQQLQIKKACGVYPVDLYSIYSESERIAEQISFAIVFFFCLFFLKVQQKGLTYLQKDQNC